MSPRAASGAAIPPEAIALLERDQVMRGIIARVGPFEPSHEPDLWWSLIDAITSQQLSIKAAATIAGRIAALVPGDRRPTPAEIIDTPDESLRACGLSRAKTTYVKDLAARWLDGSLEPERLHLLSDEEVQERLVRVRGIGRWTSEMVLMFTLGRPDILPVDDLGLQVAIQEAYDLPARPGRVEMERIAEPWRPWRSIASFYLWRSRRV